MAGLVTDEGAGILAGAASLVADGFVLPPILAQASVAAEAYLTGDPQTAHTASSALESTVSLTVTGLVGHEVGPEIEPIIVLAGDSPVVAWKCDPETVQVSKPIPSTLIVWKRDDPVVTVAIPDDTLLVSASLTGTVAR